ncbi:MAG: hypothetical protein QME74_10980, partial [Candidatus Edwardsbacteria bacterium]|nr:hypothetical protein [Candidatus Edwardsbacteria bacterium]
PISISSGTDPPRRLRGPPRLGRWPRRPAGRPGTMFDCDLLLARISARTDAARAAASYAALLEKAPNDDQRADILYELYFLTGNDEHRAAALTLYKALQAISPDQEYVDRISKLASPRSTVPHSEGK